jgi:hypothetical protein
MSNALKTRLRWLNPQIFFAIFSLLGSIGNHQRVGFWRNMKKSQNHCTLIGMYQEEERDTHVD